MATFKGNDGVVKIGTNTVAEVTAFSLTQGAATMDDTALGDTYDSHLVGTLNWSGSIDCWWDDTNTTGQGAMTNGASVTLVLLPEGAAVGAAQYTGTATITGIDTSNANNTTVTASFSFTGNGALTIGTVSA